MAAETAAIVTKELEPAPRSLADGIRFLHTSHTLCDIFLTVGEETFPAHQTMLCAMSPAFGRVIREAASEQLEAKPEVKPEVKSEAKPEAKPEVKLEVKSEPIADATEQKDGESAGASTTEGPSNKILEGTPKDAQEEPAPMEVDPPTVKKEEAEEEDSPKPFTLRVRGVTQPETVRILLDYIYQVGTGASWEYSPSDLEVNKEILHLSRQFELKYLHEHAARWLARGVTATNVVERLVICEDFKLGKLREKLIEQLTAHPNELSTVCRSSEILAHPRILQELLVQMSILCGMERHGSATQRKDSIDEPSEKHADEVHERKGDKHEKEEPEKAEKEEKKVETRTSEKPLKKKRIA